MSLIKNPFTLILILSIVLPAKSQKALSEENLIVLEDVTLIDGTDNEPIEKASIVIQGSRIVEVGRTGDIEYPDNAKIFSLKGRYVIPGLIDVHAHIQTPIHEEVMKMLLAYGITSIRIPGGTDIGVEVKKRVAAGEMIGPHVFTGGRLIDGKGSHDFEVLTEKDIREEVRRQYEDGVDLVKFYALLPSDLLRAGVDEAHKLNIQAVGHLSNTFWTEAAESGIDGLLHSGSGGPLGELIGMEHRRRLADSLHLSVEEFTNKSRSLGFLIGLAGDSIHEAGQLIYNMIDIDGPEVDRLIHALLENNTMVDPTLVTEESLVFGDEVERVLSHLEPYNAPKSVRDYLWGENWESGNRILQGRNRDIFLSFKPLFRLAQELTIKFHGEGVLLGAGTDVGMPWMTPGASLHRELELLVEAGIPTKDVLQIATRNGSMFINNYDNTGTIEKGKVADIVVLKGDPLEDIRNTRKIDIVIKNGELFDPVQILESLKD